MKTEKRKEKKEEEEKLHQLVGKSRHQFVSNCSALQLDIIFKEVNFLSRSKWYKTANVSALVILQNSKLILFYIWDMLV